MRHINAGPTKLWVRGRIKVETATKAKGSEFRNSGKGGGAGFSVERRWRPTLTPTVVWHVIVWANTKSLPQYQDTEQRGGIAPRYTISPEELHTGSRKREERARTRAMRSIFPRKYQRSHNWAIMQRSGWPGPPLSGDLIIDYTRKPIREGKFVGLTISGEPVIVWTTHPTWAEDPDTSDEGTPRDEERFRVARLRLAKELGIRAIDAIVRR